MDAGSIAKGAILGGIVAIVLEFIAGAAAGPASAATFYFGLVAMLIGGFIAGWMSKSGLNDGVVAGAIAGLIYVVLGLFIIFPAVSSYRIGGAGAAVVAVVIGLVLGAIGGAVGIYLTSSQKGSKNRKR